MLLKVTNSSQFDDLSDTHCLWVVVCIHSLPMIIRRIEFEGKGGSKGFSLRKKVRFTLEKENIS